MKNFVYALGAGIIMAAVIIGAVFTVSSVQGSAVQGNDYNGYEAKSTVASATPITLKTGPGSLAQITIASSSATSFQLYDNGSNSTSSATSTRIATFPSNAVAGTYTIDQTFDRGLVLYVPPGFNGSYVVTWR